MPNTLSHLSTPMPNAAPQHGTMPGRRARLARWLGAAFDRWQQNRTAAALARMDDRLLHDIGIRRADIPRVVRQLTAHGPRPLPVPAEAATRWTEPDSPRLAA